MHTHKRLIVVLALMVALVPVVPLQMMGLLSLDERERARETLQDAIGDAASEYRQRGGLQSSLEKSKSALEEAEDSVRAAERKTVHARKEVIKWRRIRDKIELRVGAALPTKNEAEHLRNQAKKRYGDLLRQRAGTSRFARYLGGAWGTADERLLRFQEGLVEDLTDAVGVLDRLESAEQERERILDAYAKAARGMVAAAETVEMSEEQLTENRRIMAEVHEHVLSLQGELARIDARLRQKAARALVEKGLLAAEDVRHAAAEKQTFAWPVYGRVSAGFLNKAYVSVFGVQHYGADLVVPQSTPVGAAADGVVFLVRDGGAKGYTYILIGHRDGYATLYGHISEAIVRNGQEVSAGETIGLSGGKPGSKGAGPMTTAPHLHFEVIQNGVNVDPLTVLP